MAIAYRLPNTSKTFNSGMHQISRVDIDSKMRRSQCDVLRRSGLAFADVFKLKDLVQLMSISWNIMFCPIGS